MCCVHVSTRPSLLMIQPGPGREYYGYLMTERHNHHHSMYECVDASLPDSQGDQNGVLFYHVEADCGTGLPCPDYNDHQELNCVVCTK